MSDYDKAVQVIDFNARRLARHDADTLPLIKAMEYLNNPMAYVDITDILQQWAKGPNTMAIFTWLDKDIYDSLNAFQRDTLIQRWIQYYVNYMERFLKQNIEKGFSNGL